MNAVLLGYQARLAELHASAPHLRVGQIIALALMSLAIVAILLTAFFSFTRRSVPLPYCLLPLPMAVYFARLGKQRRSALLQTLRLEHYYRQGTARLEGQWAGTGVHGEEFARSGHSYDKDLHLFGEGSLFELLCTCRTEVGRHQLANYLLEAPDWQDVLDRQAAVQELQSRAELREQIHLLGEFSFQESRWNTVKDWVDFPALHTPVSLRAFAFGTSILMAVLLLLGFAAMAAWSALIPWVIVLLAVHGVLGLLYRTKLLATLQATRTMGSEVGMLRQGLSLLQTQKFNSPLLARLVESSKGCGSMAAIRNLERLTGALIERDKEWFYAISRGLLIGTQLFWAIERWRLQHGKSLLRWLSTWGEFEALMALACYAYEHPHNTFPNLLKDETVFEGRGLAHPLLPVNGCVRNNISLNEQTKFYVISGSNMAGKSTLIRAIGLNAVLAYTGAPVCAERMALPVFSICASVAVQDSLLHGKSKFLAEMDRLKQAIDRTANRNPVLFLIDEMLSGTNSKDRRIAAEAIVRALIERGAIGVLSTHDLALTELATSAGLHGTNVHMGSKNGSDPMNFDYLMKPGVINESSALAIARLAGILI